MQQTTLIQHPAVKEKFAGYPEEVRKKLNYLRNLILETASQIEDISKVEETLKWDEPSYIVRKGSTIRMDWKAKNPDQYALFFNCNTSLVETFKILYGNLFKYEKNRAILFDMNETIPENEVRACIGMALQYHSLKNKPFLGK